MSIAISTKAEMTGVGLVVDDEITREQMEEVCKQVGNQYRSSKWAVGDLVNICDRLFGEEAPQILDRLEVPLSSRTNYSRVCKVFTHEQRREALTFSHHKAVASKKFELVRSELLDTAESKQLSVAGFVGLISPDDEKLHVEPGHAKSAGDGEKVGNILPDADDIRDESPTPPPPPESNAAIIAKQVNRPFGEMVRGIDKLAVSNGGKGHNWQSANDCLNNLMGHIRLMAGGEQ